MQEKKSSLSLHHSVDSVDSVVSLESLAPVLAFPERLQEPTALHQPYFAYPVLANVYFATPRHAGAQGRHALAALRIPPGHDAPFLFPDGVVGVGSQRNKKRKTQTKSALSLNLEWLRAACQNNKESSNLEWMPASLFASSSASASASASPSVDSRRCFALAAADDAAFRATYTLDADLDLDLDAKREKEKETGKGAGAGAGTGKGAGAGAGAQKTRILESRWAMCQATDVFALALVVARIVFVCTHGMRLEHGTFSFSLSLSSSLEKRTNAFAIAFKDLAELCEDMLHFRCRSGPALTARFVSSLQHARSFFSK